MLSPSSKSHDTKSLERQISLLTCIEDVRLIFNSVHSFCLTGTNFFCDVLSGKAYWFKHSDNKNECDEVSFEFVLDTVPPNVKDELLFHLNLFV